MNNQNAHKSQRFPIGTKFTPRGRKFGKECTVVDFYITTNLAGDIVNSCYVATHSFMGQMITDSHVLETTIAMGNPILPS